MPTTHTAATVRQAFATVLEAAGLSLAESQQVLGGPELDPSQLAHLRFSVLVPGEVNTGANRPARAGHVYLEQELVVRICHRLRPSRAGAMLSDYDAALAVCSNARKALESEDDAALAGIRVFYDRTERTQLDGQWLLTDSRFRAQHFETTN